MTTTIEQSIQARLAHLITSRSEWKDFEHRIIAEICDSNTSYLLAMQKLNFLESPVLTLTKDIISKRLTSIPPEFPDIYEEALNRLHREGLHWAFPVLLWIEHALQPLKLSEIAVVSALHDGTVMNLDSLKQRISWDTIRGLRPFARSLIEVTNDHVYPIHDTFRNSLIGSPHVSKQNFHAEIVSKCLEYIALIGENFLEAIERHGRHGQVTIPMKPEFDLVRYAVVSWPEHYKQVQLDSLVTEDVFEFLGQLRHIKTWSQIYAIFNQETQPAKELQTRLHIGSRFGLLQIVKKSLSSGGFEDSKESLQASLDLAAQRGHADIVELLLNHHADSLDALGLAASGGHIDTLKVILRHGFDLEQKDIKGYTPFLRAAQTGQIEAVRFLLDQGALPNPKALDGSTALHLAARTGQGTLVNLLLDTFIDREVSDVLGFVPLHYAAAGGFADIVALLIQYGATPEKTTIDNATALHFAVLSGHFSTCQALLDAGVDVTIVDSYGFAPLHLAAKEGFLAITQILLHKKAVIHLSSKQRSTELDIRAQWESGDVEISPVTLPTPRSPLLLAACNGHSDIVQAILDHAIDLQANDRNWALLEACAGGHLQTVKLLLGRNIETSTTDLHGNTALHFAAAGGCQDVVEELLDHGFSADATDENWWTPLHKATELGHEGIVKLLIQRGASVTAQTQNDGIPLHLAAKQGHILLVRALQAAEDTSSMLNNEGLTALDIATQMGHATTVEELFQKDRTQPTFTVNRQIHHMHSSLLHTAARHGHEAVVELLLDIGFDCNLEENGETPLYLATEGSHQRVVEMLIDAGAIVDAMNKFRQTPLFIAGKAGDEGVCKVLLERKATIDITDAVGDTALFQAVRKDRVSVVRLLLDSGANVNGRNSRSWTALHAAARHEGISRILLDAGADVHVGSNKGSTPLVLAAQNGRIEVVRMLLDAGADVAEMDIAGSTSLHRAASKGHLSTVQFLVERGAICDRKNANGTTALHMAAQAGHEPTVKYLVGKISNINEQSEVCGTPLSAAAKSGRTRIVEILIENGALVDSEGGPYHSALQAAAVGRKIMIVKLLLRHGAKVNSVGGQFGTALNAAIKNTQIDVIETLLENGADPNIQTNGVTYLFMAIDACSLMIVQALLKHGANPNAVVESSDTPVRMAARWGSLEIFEALVSKELNLGVNESCGSLLVHAFASNSNNIVDFLLAHCNIDVNGVNAAGRSALIFSVKYRMGTAKKFIEAKADPNTRDLELKTPLIHAVLLEDVETVKMLLENGADPSLRDCRGHDALYWACYKGNSLLFSTLLEALHSCENVRPHCATAVHAAVLRNNTGLLSELLDTHKADVNAVDENGWTPLFAARCYKFDLIVNQLLVARATEQVESVKQPSEWHISDKASSLIVCNAGLDLEVGGRYPFRSW